VLAYVAACSSDRPTAPTQVGITPNVRATWPEECDPISQKFINALFPPGTRGEATSRFQQVQNEVWRGNLKGGRERVGDLLSYTLGQYRDGALVGGHTKGTKGQVTTLANALFCFLDPEYGAAAVMDSEGGKLTARGDSAGVKVPEGAVEGDIIIAVSGVAESEYPGSKGPIITDDEQFGPFYHFELITPAPPPPPPDGKLTTFASAGGLRDSVVVQLCAVVPDGMLEKADSLFVAHNTGPTSSELLPKADNFFICGIGDVASVQPRDVLRLARAGAYRKAAAGLRELAMSYFGPKPLYAFASLGIGGRTSSFSPFGVVYHPEPPQDQGPNVR
jgi:hypothetical protein